jgi:ketosteroid isomerase-like protein
MTLLLIGYLLLNWIVIPSACAADAIIAADDSSSGNVVSLLQALEQRRLAALKDRDAATLQAVLADDYIHIHSTGRVDDRGAFIKGTLERPRRSERGALSIRVYGELAVITGEQTNLSANADGSAGTSTRFIATQVAHREQAGWRFVSMQVTPTAPLTNATPAVAANYAEMKPAIQSTDDQKAIEALEKRRAAAIAASDFDALASVLADDYLHIYGGGTTSDRAGYIDQVRKAPRVPTRGLLTIRVYGDAAVITGGLLNRIKYPDRPEALLDTSVTQVVRRVNGEWKFVSFQITPKVALTQ